MNIDKLIKAIEDERSVDKILHELSNNTNVIVLIGKNGSGKTVLLNEIEKTIQSRDQYGCAKVQCNTGYEDNCSILYKTYGLADIFADRFQSEGFSRRDISAKKIFSDLGVITRLSKNRMVYALIDEIDSGMGYYTLQKYLKDLKYIKKEVMQHTEKELKFILTANGYDVIHLVKKLNMGSKIYHVQKLDFVKIKNYDEFIDVLNC